MPMVSPRAVLVIGGVHWAGIPRAPAADGHRRERHYALLRLGDTGRVLFRKH